MVWWHILWWAAFAFGGSCCFRAAEEYPMLYCVQCCCCRVHFVNNQPADYTETICMHFVCTNVLRNIICSVQCTKPLYICNVCERHSVQCTKNQNGGLLSATCTICVWATRRPPDSASSGDPVLPEMGIIRTRSSGRRHFEGTLKPSDQLFLGSSRTSKISLRLCDGSGGVWQKKSVARLSAFCLQTCKVLTGPKTFQRWYFLTPHE